MLVLSFTWCLDSNFIFWYFENLVLYLILNLLVCLNILAKPLLKIYTVVSVLGIAFINYLTWSDFNFTTWDTFCNSSLIFVFGDWPYFINVFWINYSFMIDIICFLRFWVVILFFVDLKFFTRCLELSMERFLLDVYRSFVYFLQVIVYSDPLTFNFVGWYVDNLTVFRFCNYVGLRPFLYCVILESK